MIYLWNYFDETINPSLIQQEDGTTLISSFSFSFSDHKHYKSTFFTVLSHTNRAFVNPSLIYLFDFFGRQCEESIQVVIFCLWESFVTPQCGLATIWLSKWHAILYSNLGQALWQWLFHRYIYLLGDFGIVKTTYVGSLDNWRSFVVSSYLELWEECLFTTFSKPS